MPFHYIYEMKVKEQYFCTLLGKIKGKLSITPKEAELMFGFKMKPNAKGLVFYIRDGKQMIANWLPRYGKTKMSQRKKCFKIITSILKQIKKEIIWKFWDPIAKKQNNKGYLLFNKTNMRRIKNTKQLHKLIIAKGKITAPILERANLWVNKKIIQIKIRKTNKKTYITSKMLYIGILDNLKFKFIKTKEFKSHTLQITGDFKDPLLFLFYATKKNCSYSRCVKPKKCYSKRWKFITQGVKKFNI